MLKKKKTTSNFIQELRVLAFREAFWKPASGQRVVMAIAMTAFSLAAIQCAKAQIVPDNSLGAESSTVILDNINGLDSDRIEGGATRGANLFHSFESFNVDSGRGVYFFPSGAIENVLTRVTGGNSSNILGTLGVLGNANLFLINPNGIVFGPNARLDLNGSFTGSTADSLVFENDFQFSASNPEAPPLLTINVPIGLRFRDNPGDIVVETGQNPAPRIVSEEGDAGRLLDTAQTVNNESTVPNSIQGELVENNDVDLYRISLSEGTTITPTTVGGTGVDTRLFLFDREGLGIAANEDSSGTFQSTLPSFTASESGIYYLGVSSVANAPVSEGGEIFAFNFDTFQFEGAGPGAAAPLRGWNDFGFASGAYNITLTEVESNEASLSVAPGQTLALIGGNVILDGGSIESPGSNVALGGLTAAGTVTLNPDLSVNFPENVARGDVTITGGIVDVRGDGGGNIAIAARDLVITGQSQLLGGIAAGLGSPDVGAGDIEIRAIGAIDLDNSLIGNNVNSNATGIGGSITIETGSLSISNGGLIATSTFGEGNAGAIDITAIDTISLSGKNSDGFISNIQSLVADEAVGSSEGININTGSLTLTDGGTISTSTSGEGNAGLIDITATDTISLSAEDSDGILSNIQSSVGIEAIGYSEGININTGSLTLTDGGTISTSTSGFGNAGLIDITATDTISLSGEDSNGFPSNIQNLVGIEAVGYSEGININTGSLSLTDGGLIATSTFGEGNAGLIDITATNTISLSGESSRGFVSTIQSRVGDEAVGSSGGININTGSLSLTDGGFISTTTLGFGNAGLIDIAATDTIFLSGVNSNGLPSNIQSLVGNEVVGFSEGINIDTGSLSITDGGSIATSTFGEGNAGLIHITATDTIFLSGEDSNGFASNIQSLVGNEVVGSSEGIDIDTGSLILTDGGGISASTLGFGNAGLIDITATDTISLSGVDSNGFASNIESGVGNEAEGSSEGIDIDTGSLFLIDGSGIITNTFGFGNAGSIDITTTDTISLSGVDSFGIPSNIESQVADEALGSSGGININTGSLSLTNGGLIATSTAGFGNAGLIDITATDTISLSREDSFGIPSNIQSQVFDEAVGNSEGININAGSLSLTNGGLIASSTAGFGNAGLIDITATYTISLSGIDSGGIPSNIQSQVFDEAVGFSEGININTGSLSLTDGGLIATSTFGEGNAGRIDITATDTISLSGIDSGGIPSNIQSIVFDEAVGSSEGININTGSLSLTDGGRIATTTIGQGNAGTISITANILEATRGSIIQTNTTTNFAAGDIDLEISDNLFLSNSSLLARTDGGGKAGGITINTPQLTIAESASISALTTSSGDGGTITVNAPQFVTLGNSSELTVETSSSGPAGNINITTENLTIGQDAQLSATATSTSTSTSRGGTINVNSSNIDITGLLGIFAETEGEAPAGTLNIGPDGNGPHLDIEFTDRGIISASTSGSGEGGDINLSAPETITISGQGRIGVISTGAGNAGEIHIRTQQLAIANQTEVSASTSGTGRAGNITITANSFNLDEDATVITNTSDRGKAGEIIFNLTDSLNLTDSRIEASTAPGSTGDGGDIDIDPIQVNLHNSAIAVNSQGMGNGGNINLIADNLNLDNGSSISAETASGEGGNIFLEISDILSQSNNSSINTTAGGVGNGGNITINSLFVIALEDSDIIAQAFEGRGGNINITTQRLFLSNDSDIDASSQLGIDGEVETNTPEVDPTQGLVELPENAVDAAQLIAQNVCSQGKKSEFIIAGRGGLPENPHQIQNPKVTEVVLVDTVESEPATVSPSFTPVNSYEIVPANGWILNENGQVVLVAHDRNTREIQGQKHPSGCQPR